jgi:CDP-glucose 4,6-dehydratase
MNAAFWRGKPVFITGHSGFKGSWMTLWLERLGARVSGYSLPPPDQRSLFCAAAVGERVRSTFADVRDGAGLHAAMSAAEPAIAFHLAAQPLVRASYREPAYTYAVNVMGTVNFLEAVRQVRSVRAAVVVTSDKCYENRGHERGYREDAPMGGSDPYSSSKGCAELVTAAYRRSFFEDGGASIASARAGNVIGGGDWAPDRIIPDLVRSAIAGEPLRLRNPHAVRPWQFVLEPLRGYLDLAERLWHDGKEHAGGWNFGPGDESAWTVLDVVRTAASLWGEGASWCLDTGQQPHEDHRLTLDSSRAHELLGWRALLDFETTISWTVSWYRRLLEGDHDMRTFSDRQIARYEALLPGAPKLEAWQTTARVHHAGRAYC